MATETILNIKNYKTLEYKNYQEFINAFDYLLSLTYGRNHGVVFAGQKQQKRNKEGKPVADHIFTFDFTNGCEGAYNPFQLSDKNTHIIECDGQKMFTTWNRTHNFEKCLIS